MRQKIINVDIYRKLNQKIFYVIVPLAYKNQLKYLYIQEKAKSSMHTEEVQIRQTNIKETQNSSLRQNEKENESSSQFIKKSQDEQIEQGDVIFSQTDIRCKCGNPIFLYCSSQNCSQSAVLCNESKSQCFLKHNKCINLLRAENLHKQINQKIIKINSSNQTILQEIQSNIDKIIDGVSEMQSALELQLKTFGLNSSQNLFVKTIFNQFGLSTKAQTSQQAHQYLNHAQNMSGKEKIINGQFMNNFEVNTKQSENYWFDDSLNQFKSIIRQTKKISLFYLDKIEDFFLDLHLKYSKEVIQELDLAKYFANSKVFEQSLLLPNNKYFSKFQEILASKIAYKSIRKVFTYKNYQIDILARQNFNKKELIKQLEGESNLLFLFENNYRKKMGFFSASIFQSSNKSWIVEEQKKSFIFSLDCDVVQMLTSGDFSLKYDSTNSTIVLGQYYEGTTVQNPNQNTNKNGFSFSFKNNPYCELILPQKPKQMVSLFGNQGSVLQTQINYKLINGADFNGFGKRVQKLQIYKVDLL